MNLMERLEHTVTTLDGYCPIERPINPDGPEAAALIRELVDTATEFQRVIRMNASTRTLEAVDRELTVALAKAKASQ